LDYKVDEKKLKEVFRLAGKVVSAELSLDKEGKSRGFGVVEYEHPVEAVQAICILFGRFYYIIPDMVPLFFLFINNQMNSSEDQSEHYIWDKFCKILAYLSSEL
jgi:RNA recognition motif-containing protein